MRIAFYAPMKAADHPSPSGDRLMARLLLSALGEAGHAVEPASRFRSYDGAGDAARQQRIAAAGGRLAARLVRRYRARPARERARLWFTYHVYHKAPDFLGPPVSRQLGIPYVIAEASHAPKRADGPWAAGFAAAAAAIGAAERVFGLNPADRECVLPLLSDPRRLVPLKPFIRVQPYAAAAARRRPHRDRLIRAHRLEPGVPLIAVAAMMRPGDKLASYRVLGEALARLTSRPWRLVVAGDGPARSGVEAALAALGPRVTWLGAVEPETLAGVYAACDIYAWPAINEAWGMALIEAQAAGLPVVAGRSGGVAEIVEDGRSGLLVTPGDPRVFAEALATLLDEPATRAALGAAAGARMARDHDIGAAARVLAETLDGLAIREGAAR